MIPNHFSPMSLSMASIPSRQQQTQTYSSLSANPSGDSFQLTFSGKQKSLASQLRAGALAGNSATVRAILNQNIHPDSPDSHGITALRGAACSGDVDSIQALLDAGATVEHKAHYDNQTALAYAVSYAKPAATQVLLEAYQKKSIDPAKELEKPGKTLLHRMIEGSDYGITADDIKRTTEALVKAGLDINQHGIYGSTPLTLAVGYYRPMAVEGLLLAGADPNKPNIKGETPLMLAKRYPNIQKILKAHRATATPDKNTKLEVASDAADIPKTQVKSSGSSDKETFEDWTLI